MQIRPTNRVSGWRKKPYLLMGCTMSFFLFSSFTSQAQSGSVTVAAERTADQSANSAPKKNIPTPHDIRQNWHPLGRGDIRWLGFRLYHATLWVPTDGWQPNKAFALELRYARDISSTQLVNASIGEMSRINNKTLDDTQRQQWEKSLQMIFPNVREGDVIIGLSLPGQGAVFFHQNQLLGQVTEPEFAEKFFGIWLNPRTREPNLRRQLLGLK